MNKIILNKLNLKTFTEQDALDYCLLNNINPDNITALNLKDNELTDISGIKLFKNLKLLDLSHNKIKDISVLKDLNRLNELDLNNNNIRNISFLKNLIKLKKLFISFNNIRNISVIQYLKNLEILDIEILELKSDQVQYINKCKKLKELRYDSEYNNIDISEQLNKNIIIK